MLELLSVKPIAELCNGSTADSDSVCWGSNPYSAANERATQKGGFFVRWQWNRGFSPQRLRQRRWRGVLPLGVMLVLITLFALIARFCSSPGKIPLRGMRIHRTMRVELARKP